MSQKPPRGRETNPLRDPAEPDETAGAGEDGTPLPDPSFTPQQMAQMDHKPSSV